MGAMASQITSLTIVYSTVYSGRDQRKRQSSASLAFVRGIHRGPMNSPHKWPVTRKMFPFDDVIMNAEDHTIRAWQSHPLVLVKTFKIDSTPRKSGSRGDHDFNTLKPRDEYICGSKLGQTRLRSCIVAYSAPNLGLTGWWFFVNIRASVKTESQYDTDQDTPIFIQWMNLKLSFEKYRPFYSDIGVLIMQQFLSKLRSNWIWNG